MTSGRSKTSAYPVVRRKSSCLSSRDLNLNNRRDLLLTSKEANLILSLGDFGNLKMPNQTQQELPFIEKGQKAAKPRKPRRKPTKDEVRLRKVLKTFGYQVLKMDLRGNSGSVILSMPKG